MSHTYLLNHLQHYVEQQRDRYDVPALSIAVDRGGECFCAAVGTLNFDTGVQASTDSLFQVGSITKVITATLIMQLVQGGKLHLDKPLRSYLPSFHVADQSVTASVTVRQLLSHTAGFGGDFFDQETDECANAITRYFDRCYWLPQLHASGDYFSYSNAAFGIAGHLIEQLLGISWFEAVRRYVFKPLGMHHSVAHPSEVLAYSAAIGHQRDSANGNRWRVCSPAYFALSGAAFGTSLSTSASDLLRFGRAHMPGNFVSALGLTNNVLKSMQQSQVRLPGEAPLFVTDWGLGWSLVDDLAFSHAGATIGQQALLWCMPGIDSLLVVQTNGYCLDMLYAIVMDMVLEIGGQQLQLPEPVMDQKHISFQSYTGRYESLGYSFYVYWESGQLWVEQRDKISLGPPLLLTLKSLSLHRFASYREDGSRSLSITFVGQNTEGKPEYLFADLRLNRRI